MRTWFYWPGMWAETRTYINSCPWCQKHKGSKLGSPGPMELKVVSRRNELLSIDIVGPFGAEGEGRKAYSLTMVDVATGYVRFSVLRRLRATDCIRAIEMNWLTEEGRPERFVSDRGVQFMSDEFRAFFTEKGVKLSRTMVEHPAGNANAERVHRWMNERVGICMDKWPGDWEHHWGTAWSVALAGCGIQAGGTYGATNEDGTKVIDGEVDAGHLFHTYLRALDLRSTGNFNIGGRKFPIADPALGPIREILS